MPVCPMARHCSAMMESSRPAMMMSMAGFLMLVLGVVIVIWPSVLPWLVAAMVIALGACMLMMAQVFRGLGLRHREAGG